MRQRCLNKKFPRYNDYGGRGIQICSRWSDFDLFLQDMGPRPSLKYSLNRVDNDGNYEPGNCNWASDTEQNRNKRGSRKGTSIYKGVSWSTGKNCWTAAIKCMKKSTRLGSFKNEWDAAEAYNAAAVRLFGDSAFLNKRQKTASG